MGGGGGGGVGPAQLAPPPVHVKVYELGPLLLPGNTPVPVESLPVVLGELWEVSDGGASGTVCANAPVPIAQPATIKVAAHAAASGFMAYMQLPLRDIERRSWLSRTG